jgi:hypothetical protein
MNTIKHYKFPKLIFSIDPSSNRPPDRPREQKVHSNGPEWDPQAHPRREILPQPRTRKRRKLAALPNPNSHQRSPDHRERRHNSKCFKVLGNVILCVIMKNLKCLFLVWFYFRLFLAIACSQHCTLNGRILIEILTR